MENLFYGYVDNSFEIDNTEKLAFEHRLPRGCEPAIQLRVTRSWQENTVYSEKGTVTRLLSQSPIC